MLSVLRLVYRHLINRASRGVVRQEQLLYSKAIQSNILISYCILNLYSVRVGVLQPKSIPFNRHNSPVTPSLGCTTHVFLYSTILALTHCHYSSFTASNKQSCVTCMLKTYTPIPDSSDINRQNKGLLLTCNIMFCSANCVFLVKTTTYCQHIK